jgi:hypothetical protein
MTKKVYRIPKYRQPASEFKVNDGTPASPNTIKLQVFAHVQLKRK